MFDKAFDTHKAMKHFVLQLPCRVLGQLIVYYSTALLVSYQHLRSSRGNPTIWEKGYKKERQRDWRQ